MKVKRSTGIKRITIACTFLLPIFILFLAGLVLAVNLEVIAGFLTVVILISIPVPVVAYKVGYWISDGFQRDKE